jgi:ribosome biogenesis GTPase
MPWSPLPPDAPRRTGSDAPRRPPASGRGRGASSFPPTPGGDPTTPPSRLRGRLLETVGGVYRVLPDAPGAPPGAVAPVDAFLRGRLKQEARTGERLVAGDRVLAVRGDDGTWTIDEVEPRRTELVRAGLRGRKAKVVAANVDRALVVVSAVRPDLRLELLDRFLALAELSGLPAVVVVNKVDLPGADAPTAAVSRHLAAAGYPVVPASAESGEGVAALSARVREGTSVIMGPSGVGKSSLLNAMAPDLELRTGEVSRRRGGGRHTTVSARLVSLGTGSGWVVDTPGFSDVAAFEPDPAEVTHAFPEFRERAGECRFRGCTHLHEPGCEVRRAVEAGEIPPGRHESYRRMVTPEGPPGAYR